MRNDLVAGDGRLLVSWFDSPSYLGALSIRDKRGVFSRGSPDCFEGGRDELLGRSSGDEGLSDIVEDVRS